MIDLREINETIDELKRKGDTIQAAERLALMYIAKDYMQREERERMEREERLRRPEYSQAAAPSTPRTLTIEVDPTSEFLAACDGAPMGEVFAILDAHMEALRVLYPKEYDAIVARISAHP